LKQLRLLRIVGLHRCLLLLLLGLLLLLLGLLLLLRRLLLGLLLDDLHEQLLRDLMFLVLHLGVL
jgi:hypothetical protein